MSRKFEGKPDNNDKDEETLGSFYMGRMQAPVENERVLPRGLLAGIVVVIFAGILWYAYPDSSENYDAGDVPVIKADAATYKFTPDDPGGMEVRHQDSTVFNPLVKKPAEDVERLLPKPEEPLNKQDAIQSGDTKPAVAKPAQEAGLNLAPAAEDGGEGAEKVVSKDDAAKTPTLTELATAKAPEGPAVDEDAPAVVKAEEAKPAEKAAVKEEPKAAEKKETASTGASGFYMQLGAFRDTSKVNEEWSKMQKKFPKSLGGLSKRVEKADLGSKGTWYRLHAGPVAESKAREICTALKADGAGCMVKKL